MPAARQRSRSPFMRVRGHGDDRHGAARSRARRADRAVASKPSISGICTSMRTTSKRRRRERRGPRGRSPRASRVPRRSSMRRATSWLTALSSASSTRSARRCRRKRRALSRRYGRRAHGVPTAQADGCGTCCRSPTSLSTQIAPAHQRHEPGGDRQPQPGAAVRARRRPVRLREALEDQRAACRPECRCPVSRDGEPQRDRPSAVGDRLDARPRRRPRSVNLIALPMQVDAAPGAARPGSPEHGAGTSATTS